MTTEMWEAKIYFCFYLNNTLSFLAILVGFSVVKSRCCRLMGWLEWSFWVIMCPELVIFQVLILLGCDKAQGTCKSHKVIWKAITTFVLYYHSFMTNVRLVHFTIVVQLNHIWFLFVCSILHQSVWMAMPFRITKKLIVISTFYLTFSVFLWVLALMNWTLSLQTAIFL